MARFSFFELQGEKKVEKEIGKNCDDSYFVCLFFNYQSFLRLKFKISAYCSVFHVETFYLKHFLLRYRELVAVLLGSTN